MSFVSVLGSMESMMPLHSAIASARLKSNIAVDSTCWSCLSQVLAHYQILLPLLAEGMKIWDILFDEDVSYITMASRISSSADLFLFSSLDFLEAAVP
ncbi:hypothetical protein Prudu_021886, partial [Prunus dulcis]